VNETFRIIFGLLGGLAIFIYGMNLMSEGLQKVAGERMRQVLGILTKNVFFGVIAGAITTMVLQSSSATTVMVIGFVSAGLMNLPQAISVILGANIGTTITAQLIAFKLSNYIYPIIVVGFLMHFMGKKERTKNIGLTIFAFGLLFVGIGTMSSLMKPLAKSPVFVEMITKVSHVPILGVLVGSLMTVVVQSSSATIAVLQNFASTPGPDGISSIIGLSGAIPVLLGDNIGTTITALLACIGQSKNAKRTAIAHSIFNVVGAVLFLLLLHPFTLFVQYISPRGPELEIISRQIANAHTSFNILNTLLWMPFVWLMVKIVTAIIPGSTVETKEETSSAIYLDSHILNQPVFAMTLCQKEVMQSCETILKDMKISRQSLVPYDKDKALEIQDKWKTQRNLQREIQHYLANLVAGGVATESQNNAITELLLVSSGLERICIQMYNIIDQMIELDNKELSFSDIGESEFRHSLDAIYELFKSSIEVLKDGDDVSIVVTIALREKLTDMEKEMQDNHLNRLNSGVCDPKMTPYFNTIVNDLTSIGTYCLDICQSLSYGLNVTVDER